MQPVWDFILSHRCEHNGPQLSAMRTLSVAVRLQVGIPAMSQMNLHDPASGPISNMSFPLLILYKCEQFCQPVYHWIFFSETIILGSLLLLKNIHLLFQFSKPYFRSIRITAGLRNNEFTSIFWLDYITRIHTSICGYPGLYLTMNWIKWWKRNSCRTKEDANQFTICVSGALVLRTESLALGFHV